MIYMILIKCTVTFTSERSRKIAYSEQLSNWELQFPVEEHSTFVSLVPLSKAIPLQLNSSCVPGLTVDVVTWSELKYAGRSSAEQVKALKTDHIKIARSSLAKGWEVVN